MKIKTYFIFSFITLITFLLSCNHEKVKHSHISYPEYYRGYSEVQNLITNNQLDEAIIHFDSISHGVPHIPSDHLFRIAKTCAKEGRCKLSANYLEMAIENGREYGKGITDYKTIDYCQEEIDKILEKESNIHQNNFNFQYKAAIDSMHEEDQNARTDMKNIKYVDSLNMINLLSLIHKHGFPSEKIIGHQSAFNAFIIILHMDRDKHNEIFKPILEKAIKEGQLSPNLFAWIVDRRRYWSKEKLEPYYYRLYTDAFYKLDKKQQEEINKRRYSIGLKAL